MTFQKTVGIPCHRLDRERNDGGKYLGRPAGHLDGSEPVRDVSGPLGDRHGMARVMIRMHRAPVGYVELPAAPARASPSGPLAWPRGCWPSRCDGMKNSIRPPWTPQSSDGWLAAVPVRTGSPRPAAQVSTIIVCTRDRRPGLRECLSPSSR